MRGNIAEAQKVFGTAAQVAQGVRLGDLLRSAEQEFSQPVGDTARSQQLPAPPAAKTDSQSKPGAKAGAKPPAKK
jgi:hypothetical protein